MQRLSSAAKETLTSTDKAVLQEIVVAFFYWWFNQTGTNTEQGFQDWCQLQK